MILGTLGGVITGFSLPVFYILFGRLLDSINDASRLTDTVDELCIDLVIVACINLFSGFLQVGRFTFEFDITHNFFGFSIFSYTVGQLLESVKLKNSKRDMFELFYPKKLDGLIHVAQVNYLLKLQKLLEK